MRRRRNPADPSQPKILPCPAGCIGGRVIRAGPSEVCIVCGGTGIKAVYDPTIPDSPVPERADPTA